jgi:hypothetical protein
MNESILDLSMRLGHVNDPEEPLTLDLADSDSDLSDRDDSAPTAAEKVAKPDPVTIHEMKRVLGISDEEHNTILVRPLLSLTFRMLIVHDSATCTSHITTLGSTRRYCGPSRTSTIHSLTSKLYVPFAVCIVRHLFIV